MSYSGIVCVCVMFCFLPMARPAATACAGRARSGLDLGGRVRHHFSSSSLILSPPLATGTTQIGVASADELRCET
jgi:hypothetical protein